MGEAIKRWLKQASEAHTADKFSEEEANALFDKYMQKDVYTPGAELDTLLDLSSKYNLYKSPINTETLQLLQEAKPLLAPGAYNKYLKSDNTLVLNKLLNLATSAQINNAQDPKIKGLRNRLQEAQMVNLYVDDPDYEITDKIWSRYKPTPWQVARYNRLRDIENSPEYAAAGNMFGSLFGPSRKQKELLEQRDRAAFPVQRWLSDGE